jgi:hypothetical protein
MATQGDKMPWFIFRLASVLLVVVSASNKPQMRGEPLPGLSHSLCILPFAAADKKIANKIKNGKMIFRIALKGGNC